MGGQRFAVWTGAGRSARASGDGHAGSGAERLAVGRACAAGDARDTLGPPVVSFTSRGGIPEGPRPPGFAAPSCLPAAHDGNVIARSDPQSAPIGRVVATELKPATPHQFHFWTANETTVGIGAIVKVQEAGSGEQGEGRVVYGVVTDGFAYSDLATPLHDVVGAEGDPARAADAPTVRQEIRLRTPAVLRQEPDEPLQPVPIVRELVATEAHIAR